MHLAFTALLCLALWNPSFSKAPQEHQTPLKGSDASMAIVSGKVEQVFKFVDEDDYQFIAYQVSYKGHSVIVEDPIGSTNISVGGEIKFLVVRHDMTKSPKPGKKIVSFLVTKQQA